MSMDPARQRSAADLGPVAFTAARHARMTEWAKALGVIPGSDHACIHRLVTGAKRGRARGCRRNPDECWPVGTDHPTLWLRAGDRRPALFVSQPYQISAADRADLEEFCAARGFTLEIDAEERLTSWYWPGSTLLVLIYRADVYSPPPVSARPSWSGPGGAVRVEAADDTTPAATTPVVSSFSDNVSS